MTNIYKPSLALALGFLMLVLSIFSLGPLTADTAYAQDQAYSEEYEDNYEIPENTDPLETDNFDENEDQNPDPEFMEEQEPGEFDQSDDVTELDDNNY